MSKALIPGSFDPVTNGHLNIIKRAAKIFDEVYVVVFINPDKKYLFSIEEREYFLSLAIKECLPEFKNIFVTSDEGYVVDFMKKHEITTIVKGIRNEKDFLYEKEMAEINKKLSENAETMFLISEKEYSDISSSMVKEHILSRQSVKKFIPAPVLKLISERNF